MDFRTVPIGDIKLLQPVVDTEVIELPVYDESSILKGLKATNPFKVLLERMTVKVIRTVQNARILSSNLNTEPFTVVTYHSINPDDSLLVSPQYLSSDDFLR